MAAEAGPSVADIRKQVAVDSLRRAPGNMAAPDPMDEALRIAKQRAAISSLNQTSAGGDADALRAENERLEAQIARRQLEEKLTELKKPEGASEWQGWLMEQVKELQGQIGEMRQAQNEAMQAALQERLNIMSNELERLHDRPAEESPMLLAKNQIQEAMALVEFMRPASKDVPPPPPDHTNLELRAWEKRVEIDQERWRAEREDRHDERLAEIEADRQLRQQEIEVSQRRADQVERAITTTLPRIIDLGQQFMEKFMGTPAAGATGAAAPRVAAYAMPENIPAGCKSGPCQQCSYHIVYREEWPSVQCAGCGATYALTPDEPAPDNVIPMGGPAAPASYAWEQQGATQEVANPTAAPFV